MIDSIVTGNKNYYPQTLSSDNEIEIDSDNESSNE